MSFSSAIFLFYFLPVFFLCYYAVPAKWKNGAALIGSLVFYAWGEPFGLLFLLASIAVCGLLLRGMGAGAPAIRRKRLLILGIVLRRYILLLQLILIRILSSPITILIMILFISFTFIYRF